MLSDREKEKVESVRAAWYYGLPAKWSVTAHGRILKSVEQMVGHVLTVAKIGVGSDQSSRSKSFNKSLNENDRQTD